MKHKLLNWPIIGVNSLLYSEAILIITTTRKKNILILKADVLECVKVKKNVDYETSPVSS